MIRKSLKLRHFLQIVGGLFLGTIFYACQTAPVKEGAGWFKDYSVLRMEGVGGIKSSEMENYKKGSIPYVEVKKENGIIDSLIIYNLGSVNRYVKVIHAGGRVVYVIKRDDIIYGDIISYLLVHEKKAIYYEFVEGMIYPDNTISCFLSTIDYPNIRMTECKIEWDGAGDFIAKLLLQGDSIKMSSGKQTFNKKMNDNDFYLVKYLSYEY